MQSGEVLNWPYLDRRINSLRLASSPPEQKVVGSNPTGRTTQLFPLHWTTASLMLSLELVGSGVLPQTGLLTLTRQFREAFIGSDELLIRPLLHSPAHGV